MVLRSETKSLQASTARQMESRGSIMHKFVNADATLPIIMQDLNDPVSKVMQLTETSGRDVLKLNERHSRMSNHSVFIHFFSQVSFKMQNTYIYSVFSSLQVIDLIKRLAEVNQNRINRTTTEDSIKVYQLLRVTEKEGLEKLWKEFKNNDEQRSATLY